MVWLSLSVLSFWYFYLLEEEILNGRKTLKKGTTDTTLAFNTEKSFGSLKRFFDEFSNLLA
jgi:hypothetical protein